MHKARWVSASCLLLNIGLPGSATAPLGGDAGQSATLVYVVNWAPVPEATLAAAEGVAREVLGRAGVPSEWRDCTEPTGRTSALCVPKAGPDELLLDVLGPHQRAALRGTSNVLGLAMLPQDGSRASQAAVFLEKADALSRLGNASIAQVLGHAMAHEIGHLLLESSEHSDTGLMCAQWSGREIQRAAWGQLHFTPEESARLSATVAARRRPFISARKTVSHARRRLRVSP